MGEMLSRRRDPSTILISSCSGGLDVTPPAGVGRLRLLHDQKFPKSCIDSVCRDEGRPASWEWGSWWTGRGGACWWSTRTSSATATVALAPTTWSPGAASSSPNSAALTMSPSMPTTLP
ncbi:hypothetical protein Taro_053843 [Colocasia esculenta]|uniref:Uncharacterized protein n=1 Tax=Colocasia esculenta TaxID=4460 RepID=A0A843XPB0_COLES|nr:hypothetical protein [Colocasia esculenta]